MNTDPFFSSDAQEVFVPGERVFFTRSFAVVSEGAEATYAGHLDERIAVLSLDTDVFLSVPFDSIKNLYR